MVSSAILCISPGPSNLYIMARAMQHGTATGLASATGMAFGSLIYVVASAFGLAAVFKYSPTAYLVLKMVGAVYLVYLGISYLRSHSETGRVVASKQKRTFFAEFKQSVIVELTNPKTALFFIAFLPQFINASVGHVTVQFILLGVIYMIIAFLSDVMVALFSGRLGSWLQQHPKFQHYQDKASGSLLCGIGGYIALQEALR